MPSRPLAVTDAEGEPLRRSSDSARWPELPPADRGDAPALWRWGDGGVEERILLRRAQLGTDAAFSALVRLHQETVFRLAYLLTRDAPAAARATTEAALDCRRALRRWRRGETFRARFLRSTAICALGEKVRGRRAGLTSSGTAGAESLRPFHALAPGERAQLAWSAVGDLSGRHQVVLLLSCILSLPRAELMAALGDGRRELEREQRTALTAFRAVVRERYPALRPEAEAEPPGEDAFAFEEESLGLVGHLAVPATPDVAAAVENRLAAPSQKPSLVRGFPGWRALWSAVILAAGFALGALALAVAPEGVRDFFGATAERPTPVATPLPTATPAPTPAPTPAIEGFARPATLTEARALAPFALRFPEGWGDPDAVYVWKPRPDSAVIILSYLGGGFDLYEGELAATFPQGEPPQLQETAVAGQPARWLAGGAVVIQRTNVSGTPVVERSGIIERNTLVWEKDGVVYRMETSRPLPFAVAIAEAVR